MRLPISTWNILSLRKQLFILNLLLETEFLREFMISFMLNLNHSMQLRIKTLQL